MAESGSPAHAVGSYGVYLFFVLSGASLAYNLPDGRFRRVGYAASAVAYHQVPAFMVYFFGGCVIGHWRQLRDLRLPQSAGVLAWLLTAALLIGLNPAVQGDELLGARGAVLFCACFAVVWVSGHAVVAQRLAPLARWLGDITYGCYLLHPLFFFGLVWFVLPQFGIADIGQASGVFRVALLAAILTLSCVMAAASERWFEAPLRRWGKRMLWGRPGSQPAPYKDAASISS